MIKQLFIDIYYGLDKPKSIGTEISIYSGDLTLQNMLKLLNKINIAFPKLDNTFFETLIREILNNKFSDKRFEDAVNHVIDTCLYPQPTIANFISYDIKVKLYTYQEVVAMAEPHNDIFKTYIGVRIKDYVKPVYAHINDVKKYKLELWNNNK